MERVLKAQEELPSKTEQAAAASKPGPWPSKLRILICIGREERRYSSKHVTFLSLSLTSLRLTNQHHLRINDSFEPRFVGRYNSF
jgi:hypothetical protein